LTVIVIATIDITTPTSKAMRAGRQEAVLPKVGNEPRAASAQPLPLAVSPAHLFTRTGLEADYTTTS